MSLFNKEIENRPVKKVPVKVQDLRHVRQLVENVSRAVHSNGHIGKDDKLPMLARLSSVKKTIDSYLQLEMFSAAQLDE